ncbi:PEGA domain-containing protein [uncultured Methanoregula sp.]|uniref:PEGA domain-containing protein n=1 Tax=uncultured Methanoregula sp. TaxID=1005933 RepID=UPI002AABB015|nr:PEGA domain-containing protein [uncultured Methanoregula sp.]
MRKSILILGILLGIVLLVTPVVSALGGDEGWIQVNCNVDGASVSFNGEYKGITSGGSLTVPVYTTGAPVNSVTVDKSGYTPYSTSVEMPLAGQTRVVYATLNPIPAPVNYGSISVESQPSGAQIYFNGDYRGLSPLVISEVWPGKYTIEADMSGYQPYSTSVSVSSGARSSVYCPLTRLDNSGALYIISQPTNSNVYLDGVYRGITPLTLSNLAATTHIVQLDHAGYYDWKSTADVPAGGTRTVSGTLNPMPVSSTGWVYVTSSPGGASVAIDGVGFGQTPASGSLKLNNIPAGEHTVTLSLTGYQPVSAIVSVTANTVSEVNKILQPLTPVFGKGSLSISSTPSGANVFLDNNFIGITPLTVNDVAAGSHILTLRYDGYQDYSTTTLVNTGATSTVSAVLVATTPTPRSPVLAITVLGALLIAGLVVRRKP